MSNVISLLVGWLLDLIFGDPARLPHPIVWFGKVIAFCEHRLNKGSRRKLKGALMAVALIVAVFVITYLLRSLCERSMFNVFRCSCCLLLLGRHHAHP